MAALNNSKTEANLKAAFAGGSQANRRYLYLAQKAGVEGYDDVAAVFRSTAEGKRGMRTGILSSSKRLAIRHAGVTGTKTGNEYADPAQRTTLSCSEVLAIVRLWSGNRTHRGNAG